jgi:beta-N-acetylhexosaminidase
LALIVTFILMKKQVILFSIFCITTLVSVAQNSTAKKWVDSVFASLSQDQRIAQLMVVRLSERTPKGVLLYDAKVMELVKKYNVGGVCLFQGNPTWQAITVNKLQAAAKTPLMMCIDGENGLGMRFDSIIPLNRQMMMGAVQDATIIYNYGKIVAEQCKRAGIQVNYAPVVDVNNNPNNPVINDRSFGEDKYKVAQYGIAYMKGMQDAGVMACAKHFPGHGDVAVDSHKDLPVINKSLEQLDSLEFYPFKEIFKAGVGSVMIAHLAIPAIDNTPNKPTSISYKNITELMRGKMGYNGLTFTDALEMQGVKKFYPDGEASVQSIIAGNDMLCLPGDVALSIKKIKEAIKKKKLSWAAIDEHCIKVLYAKYQYGLAHLQPVVVENITTDINSKVNEMKRIIAENAITVLEKSGDDFFPLTSSSKEKTEIAFINIGNSSDNVFAKKMRSDYNAAVFNFTYKQDAGSILSTVELIKKRYKKVVIGIHNYARVPAGNFGISKAAVDLVTQLQNETNAITFVFGNPYAIKNWCGAKNLVACYEDDAITQQAVFELLQGKIQAKGKLPVTVCDKYKFGSGLTSSVFFYPWQTPMVLGLTPLSYTLSTP